MNRVALVLALVLAPATFARAQATASVSVADMTVDGNAPPGEYRGMLRTGLMPTLTPVLRCYQTALGTTPTRQGTLRLRLWVSAREVIRATEEASTLSDETLDECARAAVRTFRLPDAAPTGGASVVFTLYFLRTGIAAGPTPADVVARVEGGVPAPTPPVVAPSTPPLVAVPTPPVAAPMRDARATAVVSAVSGTLTTDVIQSGFPGTLFDACPAGTGARTLALTVTRAGAVRATARGGTLRDRTLLTCVMRSVRAVTLPSARRGTTATLTVTLTR